MANENLGPVSIDTVDLYEIRGIGVDDLRKDGEALFEAHYHEIALNKSVMGLKPDWKQYYALEEQDKLACLGVYLAEELVGYSISFVVFHMHYMDLKVIMNDVIFLADKHRATGVGPRLIDDTIQEGRARKCEMVTFHAKPGTALARMLGGPGFHVEQERRPVAGFVVQDIVFSKVL